MLRLKSIFLLNFIFLFLSCSVDDPATYDDGKPLVSAVEIGNSELPYVKINTTTTILNEPKVAGEMEIYINKKRNIHPIFW